VKVVARLEDDAWFLSNKGRLIGKGGSRNVYECVSDSSSVIKEVHLDFPGSNFKEHFIWSAVSSNSALAPLFGECRAISKSGKFLLMERLDDLSAGDRTPTLPDWVRDVWPKAFGKNSACQVKVRDYANADFSEPLSNAPLVRLAWQK
jgi:hypothetical protein